MTTVYGAWYKYPAWRPYFSYTLSSTNTTTTLTWETGFEISSSSTYSQQWIGTVVSTVNGSAKTHALNKTCNTGKHKVRSGTKTITRTTSAQSFSVSYSIQLSGSAYNGTISSSFKYSVPALTKYTIKYSANGGSSTPSTQYKYYGKSITLAKAISKSGYTFKSWKTTNGATYAGGATYTTNASTTMTAQWVSNTATVMIVNFRDRNNTQTFLTEKYENNEILNVMPLEGMYVPKGDGTGLYAFSDWRTSGSTSVGYKNGAKLSVTAASTKTLVPYYSTTLTTYEQLTKITNLGCSTQGLSNGFFLDLAWEDYKNVINSVKLDIIDDNGAATFNQIDLTDRVIILTDEDGNLIPQEVDSTEKNEHNFPDILIELQNGESINRTGSYTVTITMILKDGSNISQSTRLEILKRLTYSPTTQEDWIIPGGAIEVSNRIDLNNGESTAFNNAYIGGSTGTVVGDGTRNPYKFRIADNDSNNMGFGLTAPNGYMYTTGKWFRVTTHWNTSSQQIAANSNYNFTFNVNSNTVLSGIDSIVNDDKYTQQDWKCIGIVGVYNGHYGVGNITRGAYFSNSTQGSSPNVVVGVRNVGSSAVTYAVGEICVHLLWVYGGIVPEDTLVVN